MAGGGGSRPGRNADSIEEYRAEERKARVLGDERLTSWPDGNGNCVSAAEEERLPSEPSSEAKGSWKKAV
ncbi:hypothetical protein PGTUg99_002443 [Puccinia graminis f. sp. tritici]|uniref:Uncharacterized protein n=1 Tax=Puccinia graminis f. sp. tritici TaxID=56615 RepID=A0A5B0R4P3_PUCGR|nr:hypothetical protein PGTUg99_002443 [Puccinia graminis f. sp. tritici]